jgi:serine/threonine-protein phosphatase 2B catalytic subunit
VECCFLLFCLKIAYPNNFYLLRGNHESRQMTNAYTFKMECVKKYNMEMYERFMYAFDCMPLAATLRCKNMGTFFCVHGGLSPDIDTLDDIRNIDRFEEVPDDGPMWYACMEECTHVSYVLSSSDLLWSDPVLEEDMDVREFLKVSN